MPTTVLIVDDSKLALLVAARLLTALQPEWLRMEASSASEAMQIVADNQIDVALIDFDMPGKNGIELVGELRELHPSMPIALVTAKVLEDVKRGAKLVGAVFIAKPLSEHGLKGFLLAAAQSLAN